MDFLPYVLYTIATPIGNLEDITYRARQALEKMNVIFCEDTRVTRKLLDKFDIGKKSLFVFNKDNDNVNSYEFVLSKLQNPDNVVGLVVDAGTPCISDPGNKLLQYLINNQITIDFLPGPCAAIGAIVLSGFDFKNFSFFGFIPREFEIKKKFFEDIFSVFEFACINSPEKNIFKNHLICFYETSNRLQNTLDLISKILGNQKICIAKELTKMHQALFRGYVNELQNLELKGELVIVLELNIELKNSNLEERYTNEILRMLKNKMSVKDISQIISNEFCISKSKIYKLTCQMMKSIG